MVKDHSDSKRGNLLLPHGLIFSISSKGSLYAPSHRQDSSGALAGTRNRSMGPPLKIDPMIHSFGIIIINN